MTYATIQLSAPEAELLMDLLGQMGNSLPHTADQDAPAAVRAAYRLASNTRSELYDRLADALDALRESRAAERKARANGSPY